MAPPYDSGAFRMQFIVSSDIKSFSRPAAPINLKAASGMVLGPCGLMFASRTTSLLLCSWWSCMYGSRRRRRRRRGAAATLCQSATRPVTVSNPLVVSSIDRDRQKRLRTRQARGWMCSCPNLDLVFPALVSEPIPLGLYDFYDDHDNVSEEVLVTVFALFPGSLYPIPSGKGRLADPGYRQGDK